MGRAASDACEAFRSIGRNDYTTRPQLVSRGAPDTKLFLIRRIVSKMPQELSVLSYYSFVCIDRLVLYFAENTEEEVSVCQPFYLKARH